MTRTSRTLCPPEAYPEPLPAVAAYGLPGTALTLPDEPLPDEQWVELLTGAHRHRITGLLDAAVRDGALPATQEQAAAARAAHRRVQLRVLWLEGQLVRVVDRLSAASLDSRVLKGSAVAHLDYPEPSLRSFVDLDLLVRGRDVDRVVQVLGDAGLQRTLAEPRPGFDRRFDKGMTLVPADGSAVYELDLHRTFVLGPWGVLMDCDDLWDDGVEFTLGGHRLRALTPANRFMHACFHAALGDWPLRLGSLRDIAQMLRTQDSDPADIRRTAAAWGADAVVATAVSDARRLLELGPGGSLSSWAERYVPGRREESWLALHTQPDKTFAALALTTLRVLPRWRDKAAYVRALAMPDASYTEGRHASVRGRFAYAMRQVRKGRRVVSR